jgi:putative toxin-antitoxin system antitoxin component (TIGR02293 family)
MSPAATGGSAFVGADIGDPPGPASFAELIRQYGTDRNAAVAAIRIGFPALLLKDAGRYFKVPTRHICAVARLPEATALMLAKRGALLDAATSERLWRLADLMRIAHDVFGDDDIAKAWLRAPNTTFNDLAPMDCLDTEPGAFVVRQALSNIAAKHAHSAGSTA